MNQRQQPQTPDQNALITALAAQDASGALAIVQAQLATAEKEAARTLAEYKVMCEVEFRADGSINAVNMGGLYRLAQMYAASHIVPDHYRGKPADCFIACQMANKLRVDPMAYMQASYIVHGKPGLEAKFAIALLNQSDLIDGRVRWEMEKPKPNDAKTWICTAYVTDKETGERVAESLDWTVVKGEGWDVKKGSKWLTMPETMFKYRSAAILIRLHYSEIMLGMPMADELEDIGPEPAAIATPEQPTRLSQLGEVVAQETSPAQVIDALTDQTEQADNPTDPQPAAQEAAEDDCTPEPEQDPAAPTEEAEQEQPETTEDATDAPGEDDPEPAADSSDEQEPPADPDPEPPADWLADRAFVEQFLNDQTIRGYEACNKIKDVDELFAKHRSVMDEGDIGGPVLDCHVKLKKSRIAYLRNKRQA